MNVVLYLFLTKALNVLNNGESVCSQIITPATKILDFTEI
jgi:hypothetical protein